VFRCGGIPLKEKPERIFQNSGKMKGVGI